MTSLCRSPAGGGLTVPRQPLPFHYIELAVALFKHGGEAFGERRQRVYELVENVRRRVGRAEARGGWGADAGAACGSTRLSTG